jgi:hypothetical protein
MCTHVYARARMCTHVGEGRLHSYSVGAVRPTFLTLHSALLPGNRLRPSAMVLILPQWRVLVSKRVCKRVPTEPCGLGWIRWHRPQMHVDLES